MRFSVFPFLSQRDLLAKWGPFAHFVDAVGDAAIPAMISLEKEWEKRAQREDQPRYLAVDSFRFLRPLLTFSSRQAVLPTLQKQDLGMKDLQAAAESAKRAMWVGWHWVSANPIIQPDRPTDAYLRHQFAKAVQRTSDLSIRLGGWRPGPSDEG